MGRSTVVAFELGDVCFHGIRFLCVWSGVHCTCHYEMYICLFTDKAASGTQRVNISTTKCIHDPSHSTLSSPLSLPSNIPSQ